MTPAVMSNCFVPPSGVMTLVIMFVYMRSIAWRRFGRMPYAFRILIIFGLCIESKAFLKSMKVTIAGKWFAFTPSLILLTARIWATVVLFGRKPFWLYLSFKWRTLLLPDPDNIEYRTIGSGYFVISSGWRNELQASQGGVGLLIGRRAKKVLLDVKRISARVLRADFDGNPRTTVLVAYSPTNCAEVSDVEEVYQTLRNALQDIPAHNFLSVLADFNARIGSEVVPHTHHISQTGTVTTSQIWSWSSNTYLPMLCSRRG
jgi:hypothetical protein